MKRVYKCRSTDRTTICVFPQHIQSAVSGPPVMVETTTTTTTTTNNNNNINGGSCFPMGCVNLARAKAHARPKLTSTTKPPLNSCSTKSS
ncbi:hypothetical protein T10_4820 [Trichinella papuae]|uniref:Uncharacterized protein n=1 Tax=Trichinella papuae TaxID=268474 RepID=A0A0V1MEN7_9BILA|nr:hypothetical protein T10_4820 [Trichinella papuae]